MAHAILVMSRGPLPPTREEIATALGVEIRTIQRWLAELREANILTEQPVGRRLLCIFSNPAWVTHDVMGDRLITRPADHLIARSPDQAITHAPHDRDQFLEQQDAPKSGFSENPITDPPIIPSGGGGDHHDPLGDSPPTTTATAKKAQPCETRLGRYMAANGFGAAREFDRPELDSNHWIHFIRLQLESGMSKERIVHLLRLGAPLEWIAPAPAAPAAPDDAGELPPMTPALAMPIEQAMNRWNKHHGAKR